MNRLLPPGVHARISISEATGDLSAFGYIEIFGPDGFDLLLRAYREGPTTFPPHTWRAVLPEGVTFPGPLVLGRSTV